MLFIPIRLELPLHRRSFVSLMVPLLLLYQSAAASAWPGLRIPVAELYAGPEGAAGWWRLMLGLFRAPGLATVLIASAFWLVVCRGVEERIGSVALALVYAAGSLLPLAAAREGWIGLSSVYWAGLGGLAAVLGVAYGSVGDEDVGFFYLIPALPYRIVAGVTSTSAVFVLVFLHLVLAMSQWVHYSPRNPAPPGISAPWWIFFYPLPWLLGWLAVSRAARGVRRWKRRRALAAA